jgi:hypothetical protein
MFGRPGPESPQFRKREREAGPIRLRLKCGRTPVTRYPLIERYRRGDLFDQRRQLMDEWAAF